MRLTPRKSVSLVDERGGVLVFFALALPLLIILFVAVADGGNWFEHRRHLQLQADAAALAGGTAFGYPCTAGINANIEQIARDYGGTHTKYDYPGFSPQEHLTGYNNQVGGTPTTQLHLLINAAIDDNARLGYWRRADSPDYHADRRDFSDTSEDPLGRPCESGFVDVKVTENDLDWMLPFGEFFASAVPGLDSVISVIDARARVQVEKIGAIGGPSMLPLFVRDITPRSAAALFVRENGDGSTTLLDVEYMRKNVVTDSDGNVQNDCESGYACWDNDTPAEIEIQAGARTSVVFALSSLPECGPGAPAQCFDIPAGAELATTTPEAVCYREGVECMWADEAAQDVRAGLLFVQGYATTGGGSPPSLPALRQVTLGPGTSGTPCADGYYAYTSTACTVHVTASIDMGTFPAADARVRAFGGSCGNNGCALTYEATAAVWRGNIPIPAVGNNPDNFTPTQPIAVEWTYRNTTLDLGGTPTACGTNFNNSPCTGTFAAAHRVFSGSDPFSGPIRTAGLVDADDPTRNAYAYPGGTTARLVAGFKVTGAIARCPRTAPECDTAPDDPPVLLRVATNQGAVDCDDDVANFKDELTLGCGPLYTILDESSPRWDQQDPCNPPYANAQALFQAPAPWDCIRPQTGDMQGQFSAGMKGRILNGGVTCDGGGCPNEPQLNGVGVGCSGPVDGQQQFVAGRNYWQPIDGYGSYLDERHPGDPRVVILFMVPFGAFRDTGADQLYPIVNFGAFYVSDWGGQGGTNSDPCGIDGDVPAGWMSGHFINFTVPSNVGGGSGEKCDPSTFTPCVPVLVE